MSDKPVLIDLNTADREGLMTLPGVGPIMADRILAARPFTSPEDLQNVRGIGGTSFERLHSLVTVSLIESDVEPAVEDDAEDGDTVTSAGTDTELLEAEFVEVEGVEPAPETGEEAPLEILPPDTEAEPIILDSMGEAEPGDTRFMDESEVEAISSQIDSETEPEAQAEPSLSEVEVQPEEEVELVPVDEALPEAADSLLEDEVVESEGEPESVQEPLEEEAEQVPDETPPVSGPKAVTRGFVFGMTLAGGVLAVLMAVVLSLGFLTLVNSGLRYAKADQFSRLAQQVQGINTQVTAIQQDIDGLLVRLNNLEGLSGRINALEDITEDLSQDIDSAEAHLETLNQQVDTLNAELIELKASSDLFQGFLNGLRGLLNGLVQP